MNTKATMDAMAFAAEQNAALRAEIDALRADVERVEKERDEARKNEAEVRDDYIATLQCFNDTLTAAGLDPNVAECNAASAVRGAVTAAVLAEREACARVAEEEAAEWDDLAVKCKALDCIAHRHEHAANACRLAGIRIRARSGLDGGGGEEG